MTGGVIDRLVVALGLDASGFKKGQEETRASLDEMRADARQAQSDLNALISKSVQQKRDAAAEEARLAERVETIRNGATDKTRERDEREAGQLQRLLERKRAAHRQEAQQIDGQIAEQRKVVGEKQRGYREFERTEKQQSDRSRKRIQATRDEGTAVQALTGKVLGLFTAFTAGEGLASFLKNTLEGAAATGRLAANLGVDIEALQAWEGAVKRVGGTAANADGAIASLVKTREMLKAGQLSGDQAKVLNSFGITAQDIEDPIAAMEKFAAAKQRAGMTNAQFSLRLGMLGFDQNAINALEKGPEALRALMEESRKAGVVTDQMSEKSQRLQRRWEDLKQRSASLGRNIIEQLAPSLEKVLDVLIRLTEWAERNMPIVTGLVTGLGVALAGVAAISFVGLIGSLGGLALALGPVGMAVAAIAGGLGYIASVRMAENAKNAAANSNPDIEFRKAELARARKELEERKKSADSWSLFRVRRASHGQSGGTLASAEAEVRRQERLLALAMGRGASNDNAPVAGGAMLDQAHGLIRRFEGFRSSAYWDVNAYRAGYGSDTITDPVTGRVSRVTAGTRGVTKEMAEADLRRRVATEFIPRARAAVGAQWESLPDATKAAIVSVTYNYGSTPKSVATAAGTGDPAAVARAIEGLKGHNQGVNAGRRQLEAAHATSSPTRGAALPESLTPAQAQAALSKGSAQLERLIKAKPEAEKAAARKRYEADPRVIALRSIATTKQAAAPVVARGKSVTMDIETLPAAGKTTPPPAPPRGSAPPPPPPAAGASAVSAATRAVEPADAKPVPVRVAEVAPPPSAETPMGRAAMLLSQAAQTLLAAANVMRRGAPIATATSAGYDRGLNLGARANYASQIISNDNSRRVEAQTHIGSINVQAGRDGQSIANGLSRALRNRSLAYMADSGLF